MAKIEIKILDLEKILQKLIEEIYRCGQIFIEGEIKFQVLVDSKIYDFEEDLMTFETATFSSIIHNETVFFNGPKAHYFRLKGDFLEIHRNYRNMKKLDFEVEVNVKDFYFQLLSFYNLIFKPLLEEFQNKKFDISSLKECKKEYQKALAIVKAMPDEGGEEDDKEK